MHYLFLDNIKNYINYEKMKRAAEDRQILRIEHWRHCCTTRTNTVILLMTTNNYYQIENFG